MNGDAAQLRKAQNPTRRVFSEEMLAYGTEDPHFIVMEADIGYSTFSYLFGDAFPQRYFNVGIAELGMFATAAGIASTGRTVVCGSYGVFITMRAIEAIRSFICYPNLPVKILSSHGGITAAIDGVTHQATEDIANMATIPNMTVLAPCDSASAAAAFRLAMQTPGPVFTRLMRDPLYEVHSGAASFAVGGSVCVRSGADVTILSYGDIVIQAIRAAEQLAGERIEAEVIDLYSIKPLDRRAVIDSVRKTGACVVAENHQRRNGLGYEVASILLQEAPVPFAALGLDDTFAESGAYDLLLDKYGLSADHIAENARRVVHHKNR